MSHSPASDLRDRLRRSTAPGVVVRSALTSVAVVAAMPLILIALLVGLGALTPSLMTSWVGALVIGAGSSVLLYGTAGVALLCGILLSAFVHAGAHTGEPRPLRTAARRTASALPRLLVALALLVFAFALTSALWLLLTVGLLALAVVLFVRMLRSTPGIRHEPGARALWRRVTPGTRRALLWAIPLAPALATLGLAVAVMPASLATPGSLRELYAVAWSRLRRHPLGVVGFLVVGGLVSTGASLGGVTAALAIDPTEGLEIDGHLLASLAVLVLAVVLLQVLVGAILAVSTADATTRAPRPRPRASFRSVGALMSRATRPALGRTAMIAVVALVATLAPVPAFAAAAVTLEEPIAAAETAAAADLIVPTLHITAEGSGASPVVTAHVLKVAGASPSGSVQFFDGATPLGEPIALTSSDDAPERSYAYLAPSPVLAVGSHNLSFLFSPADRLVAPGQSQPTIYVVDAPDPETPGGGETGTPVDPPVDPPAEEDPEAQAPDRATALSADLLDAVALGGSLDLDVRLTAPGAPEGTVVPGLVTVYANGVWLGEAEPSSWVSLATTGMHAGNVLVSVEYAGAPGFLPTQTSLQVEVGKASTRFVAHLVEPADRLTWGDPHTATLTIQAAADEQRTLEVISIDGPVRTVVGSAQFDIVGGVGVAIVDLARMLPGGSSEYSFRVTESYDATPGYFDQFPIIIDPAETTTSLVATDDAGDPSHGAPGEQITLTATVASPSTGTTPSGGTVTFTGPGLHSDRIPVDAQGMASVQFTPSSRPGAPFLAEYTPDGSLRAYSPSRASLTLEPVRVETEAPSAWWSGALTLVDTRLNIWYPASGSLGAPSGTISILDAAGTPVAISIDGGTPQTSIRLVNGSAEVLVPMPPGQPQYSVVYSGDDDYLPRTDPLPLVEVIGASVTVTAFAPATAYEPTIIGVTIADVPLDLVETVTVYSTDAAGIRSTVGTGSVDVYGEVHLRTRLRGSGPTTLTAEVTFTPASGIAPVTSAPFVVELPAPVVPDVRFSIDYSVIVSPGERVFGVSVVVPTDKGWPGLPLDAVAVIRDETGTRVGSIPLSNQTISGSGTVRLSRTDTESLTASVDYGFFGDVASSAPVAITPSTRNDTFLTTTWTPVTSGNDTVVEVTLGVFGSIRAGTRTVHATVDLDGRSTPVTLTRDAAEAGNGWYGSRVTFSGSVPFTTLTAGTFPLRVMTEGNGADVGAAEQTTSLTVSRHTTEVTLSGLAAATAGRDVTITPIVTAADSGAPRATGPVTLSLYPAGATCVVEAGEPCRFAGSAVRGGRNTVYASYAGDADFEPGGVETTFDAVSRTSTLDARFSVAPDEWIVGETVTASWTVTTSARTAAGYVEFTAGSAYCGGPAPSGSCTFVVPAPSLSFDERGQAYTVRFRSSDDAPDATVSGRATPRGCYVVSARNATLDTSAAAPCVTNGRDGLLAGGRVTVTAHGIADGYSLGVWRFNGADVFGTDSTATSSTFTVTGSGDFGYTTVYAPECFTLTASPTAEIAALTTTRDEVKGTVVVLTDPNCSDPRSPTAADRAALAAGTPRYAAGTEVVVRATGAYRATSKDFYAVDTFTGVRPVPGNPDIGYVTMSADREVSATFRVPECVPFSVGAAEGGTLAVVSAARPTSSGSLQPTTGACTGFLGEGYVPGSTLVLEARADAGFAFVELAYTAGAPTPAEARAVKLATAPAATSAKRTTVVIGDDTDANVRAVFSHRDCVTVTLVAIMPNGLASYEKPLGLVNADGDNECAKPVPGKRVTFEGFTRTETTYSVLASAVVWAENRFSSYPTGRGNSYLSWSTTVGGETLRSAGFSESRASNRYVQDGGRDGSTMSGPWINLDLLPAEARNVSLTATYEDTTCASPTVVNPYGAPYQVRLLSPFSTCREPNQAAYGHLLEVRAGLSAVPGLKPVFSMPSSLESHPDGRAYFGSVANVGGAAALTLEYCAALPLTVRVLDDAGTATTLSARRAGELVADDGGCAPLQSRPGLTVSTGLPPQAQYEYSVVGAMPSFAVAADGTSAPATLSLKVNCVSVDVGDRTSRVTPSNCPGGGDNRYLKGSVVQFFGDVHDDEGLEGWAGADQDMGTTAWVVAETDRRVEVDIDYPSVWEEIGNALSSVAQRVVSGVVAAATGLVLAKMMMAKMVTVAVKGIGTLVSLAGGGDEFLKVATRLDNSVGAVLDSVNLFNTCVSVSAVGTGSLTAIPTGTLGETGAAITEKAIGNTEKGLGKLGDYLNHSGLQNASTVAGHLDTARTMVDLFGSNPSLYSRDAAKAWTSMGTGLGGCMKTGLEANAKIVLNG